jgi:hypothetical protein
MNDEERLHFLSEQLLLVRDNLFHGMSKSMQKLQARSINEALGLETYESTPSIIEAAVLAEREACAKVCEDLIGTRAMARHCADAIRARGSEDGLR